MLEESYDYNFQLLNQLEIEPFKERFPWLGGDLQTLRDTLRPVLFAPEVASEIKIPIPSFCKNVSKKEYLLGLLDYPKEINILGLVLLIHGLGGSSKRVGIRRMANELLENGFAVLRLNLRGADPGRGLASGSYSASCNSDLFPVIEKARQICLDISRDKNCSSTVIPLFGVGVSLGGTILLNAVLERACQSDRQNPSLDGLVCTSSPIDLALCSTSIERSRNWLYHRWLLQRLIRQTLLDPLGVNSEELKDLTSRKNLTIRDFDSIITAPRWGYKDVDDYYKNASPIQNLNDNYHLLPPILLLQAIDDPWVPAVSALGLSKRMNDLLSSPLKVILTSKGGHNGFHGINGCWGDKLVSCWLRKILFDKFS